MLRRKPVLVVLLTLTIQTWWSLDRVAPDPQTTYVKSGCSLYNASDAAVFSGNRNETIRNLRAQVKNQRKHFATAWVAMNNTPVAYALFQCRYYLSIADCLKCFDLAAVQIYNNCSVDATGARLLYQGCFLRYESSNFFYESTDAGNHLFCGNRIATRNTAAELTSSVSKVLKNLVAATPKIPGFYAATKTPAVPNNISIYAIAQCTETLFESECESCLNAGLTSFQICLANSNAITFYAGCFMRYSTTPFFADNQTTDINSILKPGDSSNKKAILGGVIGGASLVLVLLFFALYRRSKFTNTVPKGDILGATELKGPINYRYRDLKSATSNFSEENKLGEGGFGDVYKGTLKNGKVVAVKKLAIEQSKQMEEDFESEVKLISNVHHRNLVRLLGCCTKGQDRFLIYEYMINNNLGQFLFGEKRGSLNWNQRYSIILGIARGLAYLHEEFHVCIIHRDIKTSNILLDEAFRPKIADFGLARLLPRDQSHINTKFAGTMGYTAPEYAMHGRLSEKVDTYCYGVVILEIISGQKNGELNDGEEGEFLLQRAWKLHESGMHLEFVDKTLEENEYDVEEIKKVIEIGLLCTQAAAATRPEMSEVVDMLETKRLLIDKHPTMPVYVDPNLARPKRGTKVGSNTSSALNATASISTLSGR